MDYINYFYAIVIGYFFGVLPFSYLVPKYLKGVDVRTVGSKNVGSTNVFRTCGITVAALAFALDVAKGFFPIWISASLFGYVPALFSAFACILGHCFSFILNFKGGKGVATTAGILLYLNPILGISLTIAEFVIIFMTRTVSIASISVAIAFPITAILIGEKQEFIVFAFLLAFFVIFQHRSNIKRIIAGEEKPLDFGKKK